MYVEGEPVNGMEVFRYRNREFVLVFLVPGVGMLVGAYTLFLRAVWVSGGLILALSLFLLVVALESLFTEESLLVDRDRRILRVIRCTPFTREEKEFDFDDLSRIEVQEAAEIGGDAILEASSAELKVRGGNPIHLGFGSRSMIRRLADRLGRLLGIRVTDPGTSGMRWDRGTREVS